MRSRGSRRLGRERRLVDFLQDEAASEETTFSPQVINNANESEGGKKKKNIPVPSSVRLGEMCVPGERPRARVRPREARRGARTINSRLINSRLCRAAETDHNAWQRCVCHIVE